MPQLVEFGHDDLEIEGGEGPIQIVESTSRYDRVRRRDSMVARTHGWPFPEEEIVKARFLSRPNRFLVRCERDDGRPIRAFLPNPGRLWELLLPGATLYVHRPRKRDGRLAMSKTEHTVLAVERNSSPIFLHTHETNHAARYLIENDLIPPLKGSKVLGAEVPVGRSRFDFLLSRNGKELYLEVKSCTLFGNRIAMFPDAVTSRGRRHLLELAEMSRRRVRAAVLFLVHYPDVEWFMPDFHTDLNFSTALLQVRSKVEVIPAAVGWRDDLTLDHREAKILTIPWDYLEREVKDRGSYLSVVELNRRTRLRPGGLPAGVFPRGHYVYVGSAMANLSQRLARHQRQDKSPHWHIDYLTAKAGRVLSLPVRSSQRLECAIADALSSVLEPGPMGFGSSDCHCATHLFFSRTNPLESPAFHDLVQGFRMRPPARPAVFQDPQLASNRVRR
jgi:sugar fermentation stimulation protein A